MGHLKIKTFVAINLLAFALITGINCTKNETVSQYPADNTAKNLRDANNDTLTPENQLNSTQADITLTQQIRQAVVADENLSIDAKNIKIMAENGVVTLRGPVQNQEEKNKIGAQASQFAGVSKVNNELEIKNHAVQTNINTPLDNKGNSQNNTNDNSTQPD